MRILTITLFILVPLLLGSCVFFGADRIGGKIICDVSDEDVETCSADYRFNDVYQSTELIDITKDFVRELNGVGTVLQAGDTYGITYLGNLVECVESSRASKLSISTALVGEAKEKRSDAYKMSPGEFGKFEDIRRLGPRFAEIKAVKVWFGEIYKAEIDEDDLTRLLDENLSDLPVICRSWLREGTYIVTKTLYVDSLEYKFRGTFNKNIAIDSNNLGEFLTFSSNVDYRFTNRKTIEVNQPRDIAIGGSIPVDYFGFETEPLYDVLSRYYVYVEGYSLEK